jgi:hypothetical protein
VRGFRDLLARVMPFDLVMDQATAREEPVRISRGSVCGPGAAVAGQIRYFADRFGTPRGAIEGTEVPFDLIKRYAVQGEPRVRFRESQRHTGLVVERTTTYHGFELDRAREPLTGEFPAALADHARLALAEALVAGRTTHTDQRAVARAVARIDEYWRRSGGRLTAASPEAVAVALARQLAGISNWDAFIRTRLALDVATFAGDADRRALDELPASVSLLGDRVPLHYDIEHGEPVIRLRLREGKARRLRPGAVPALDRPVRFSVLRGHQEVLRAASLEELVAALSRTRGREQRGGRRRGRR